MRFRVLAILPLSVITMQADILHLTGTTNGRFELVGFPVSPNPTVLGPLKYTQGPGFNIFPNSGDTALINLGSFRLNDVSEAAVLLADVFDFRLFVNVLTPGGVVDGPTSLIAELKGRASLFGAERVELEFARNSFDFAFRTASGAGTFTLHLSDMTVGNGNAITEGQGPRALTGRIVNTSFVHTPEPGSMLLLGTAAGITLVLLRRRTSRA